ncbi:MAG: hypothetical protein JO218_19460 [Burkholderiales bacterium]|nr:hypothetical protein [Burkholderiales bacterium]
MSRYAAKPFLRLIECYVLDRIDQLDGKQRTTLEGMESKLRATYDTQGSWQEIVAAQMEFTDSFDSQVRAVWRGYLDHARAANTALDPNEFVMSFVDQNFSA